MKQSVIDTEILHIDTERTWRGGENQMRLLCEGLRDSNFRCHLALDPRGEAYRRLKDQYPVLSVKMSGGLDFLAALKIARYCRKANISLIDAQSSNAHSIALLVNALRPGIKVVVHRRVDFVPKPGWITRWKYGTKAVRSFVAISSAIANILRQYGVDPEKITTVPSAVDPSPYRLLDRSKERASLCQALAIDPSFALIGNASALTAQKGYEVLLRSLHELAQTERRFHCVIAGDGDLRARLEKMRIELGLEKYVSFLGWIKEVPEFLSALDILVMPSNFEGLGTLILDATYAGCAVIASDAGGIPEMIEHRKGGLISPVGNHKILAEHIKEAIQQPDLCRAFNAHARSHVEKHFSLAAMVNGNRRIYSQVLNQR